MDGIDALPDANTWPGQHRDESAYTGLQSQAGVGDNGRECANSSIEELSGTSIWIAKRANVQRALAIRKKCRKRVLSR